MTRAEEDALQLKRQLQLLVRAGWVRRYHNKTVVQVDTVGRHSYLVAWLCWFLTDGRASAALLMAAMAHDVPEAVVSDLSAPVKRLLPGVLDALEAQVMARLGFPAFDTYLSDEERYVLKLADKLEGALYCANEVHGLGNRHLAATLERFVSYLHAQGCREGERANQLLDAILQLYTHPEDLEEFCL